MIFDAGSSENKELVADQTESNNRLEGGNFVRPLLEADFEINLDKKPGGVGEPKPNDQSKHQIQQEKLKNAISKSKELAWIKMYEVGAPGLVIAVSVDGKVVYKSGNPKYISKRRALWYVYNFVHICRVWLCRLGESSVGHPLDCDADCLDFKVDHDGCCCQVTKTISV